MRMNESADAGRVVADRQEARLDDVADHLRLRVAQQLGVDVVTDRRDERQQRAGDDARQGERQGHPPEALPAAGVEVLRPPRAGCGGIFSSATYSGSVMNGRKL